MIHFKRREKKLLSEINVVPYIDVMLVLLVIFMITAPLLNEGVNVQLPNAQALPLSTSQTPILVTVDAKGRYYLNLSAKPKQPLAPSILVNRIQSEVKASTEKRTVFVKGDRHVPYEKVMYIMALLQQAGIKEVGLVTEQNDNTKS